MAWLVFLLAVVVMGDDTIADVDKDDRVPEDNTTYEALPTAEEWRNAPSCPLWGPMDSFYKEGIEKGRYLGRWWLQDKTARMLGSGLKLAQKVFVPWTLHPHLG